MIAQPRRRAIAVDRLDPAGTAEHVDRQDGPGSRRRGRLDEIRVEPRRVLLDVHEPRHGALVQNAVGRGHEAERRGDDLVAVADPQGPDAQVEPGRSARAGNPLAAAGEGRDALLEPRRERPQREHVAAQDLGHELQLAGADVRPGKGDAPNWGGCDWVMGTSRVRGSCCRPVPAPIRPARLSVSISSMLRPSPA